MKLSVRRQQQRFYNPHAGLGFRALFAKFRNLRDEIIEEDAKALELEGELEVERALARNDPPVLSERVSILFMACAVASAVFAFWLFDTWRIVSTWLGEVMRRLVLAAIVLGSVPVAPASSQVLPVEIAPLLKGIEKLEDASCFDLELLTTVYCSRFRNPVDGTGYVFFYDGGSAHGHPRKILMTPQGGITRLYWCFDPACQWPACVWG